MKTLRILAFAAVLVPAAALVAGCSGATSEQPHTSASALAKAPVAEGAHGPIRIVGAALGEVPLRPDQRTKLEALAKEAETRHASVAAARKDLVLAFADQVERGSVDRAALQPKIDAVKASAEKVRPDDLAAIDQMHALLDKEQRAAFVSALEDEVKATFRGKHHGKHGKGEKDEARGPFGHLRQLAADLQLSDAQKDTIKEKLKALREQHEGGEKGHGFREGFGRMRAAKQALESFENDDFKAASLKDLVDAQKAEVRAQHMLDVADAVLPVLTPEQRKTAAEKLRAFADRGELPAAR